VPTGGYLLPCTRQTQLTSLAFLVTCHSRYERSVGFKCNGKRVIFKIVFLCVCSSKFAQEINLLICIRKVPVSNSGKENDYPDQYFSWFSSGARRKRLYPVPCFVWQLSFVFLSVLLWACVMVGWMGYLNAINEPTGSDSLFVR